MTTLRDKLVKIGAKVVRHGRYVTFQLAEVAVPRDLFRKILSLIDDLRRRPAPALAEGIDGEEIATGEVCLDGEKNDRVAFQARADYQNHAIGWLHRGYSSLGGGKVIRFPRIWMVYGECRLMICDEDPLRRRPRESTARRKRQERCVWMARKMTEWPSKRGPITKIMPSDGCIGDTVPLAVEKWYDFHKLGWYMGNVG